MAAKAVALMLVMSLMVSTFTVEVNAFDLTDSGRSLLRLRFFTDIVELKETSRPAIEMAVASTSRAGAPALSGNGEKKQQTWVTWFNNMFSGSSSNGAPASAPSA